MLPGSTKFAVTVPPVSRPVGSNKFRFGKPRLVTFASPMIHCAPFPISKHFILRHGLPQLGALDNLAPRLNCERIPSNHHWRQLWPSRGTITHLSALI